MKIMRQNWPQTPKLRLFKWKSLGVRTSESVSDVPTNTIDMHKVFEGLFH